MKVGDLVARKHQWQNRLGVVVELGKSISGSMAMARIHWFVDTFYNGWYGEHKLEVINEKR